LTRKIGLVGRAKRELLRATRESYCRIAAQVFAGSSVSRLIAAAAQWSDDLRVRAGRRESPRQGPRAADNVKSHIFDCFLALCPVVAVRKKVETLG
jgi:hypothetical protein